MTGIMLMMLLVLDSSSLPGSSGSVTCVQSLPTSFALHDPQGMWSGSIGGLTPLSDGIPTMDPIASWIPS